MEPLLRFVPTDPIEKGKVVLKRYVYRGLLGFLRVREIEVTPVGPIDVMPVVPVGTGRDFVCRPEDLQPEPLFWLD